MASPRAAQAAREGGGLLRAYRRTTSPPGQQRDLRVSYSFDVLASSAWPMRQRGTDAWTLATEESDILKPTVDRPNRLRSAQIRKAVADSRG